MAENKNNLFSEDEELVSLSDEEIVLQDDTDDEDDGEDEETEGGLGGKNIFFLALILILAVGVIAFMMIAMQKDEGGASSEEAISQNTSVPTVSEESVLENSIEESNNDIEISLDESFPEESSEDISSDVSSDVSGEEPDEEPFHGWIINNMGYTYLYYGVGVEQFNYSNKTLGKYTDSIAAIAEKLPAGTNLFCMPIPTHIGFLYGQISNEIKNQDNFFNSYQEAFIDDVASSLSGKMNVVDVFAPFSENYNRGTALYFNTDLNWTSDAAYIAYKEFCAASGNAAITIEAYESKELQGFLGSFYKATFSEHLENNADVFRYYRNADTDACKVTVYRNGSSSTKYNLAANDLNSTSAAYSVYLGTTAPYFTIKSPCSSGKKLLIVGDGSVAAMLPYLIANYSEIHYIDAAYYNEDLSALIAENQFTDALFMTYATNAVKGDYPAHLEAMAGVQADE